MSDDATPVEATNPPAADAGVQPSFSYEPMTMPAAETTTPITAATAPAAAAPAAVPAPTAAYPAPFPPAASPAYGPGGYAPAQPTPVSAPAGYAAPVSAPAGYGPGFGYGAPVAPKPRKTGVIVMSVLTAIFVLTTVAMGGLFVTTANKNNEQKKTIASQQGQMTNLNQQMSDTKTQLSDLQTSTSDEIANLKKSQTLTKACVNDVDAVLNVSARASTATLDKAWHKMVAACIIAKAAID